MSLAFVIGFIRMGYDADFTIVDMKKKVTIQSKDMHYKCGWTPFDGKTVTGYPVQTILSEMLL